MDESELMEIKYLRFGFRLCTMPSLHRAVNAGENIYVCVFIYDEVIRVFGGRWLVKGWYVCIFLRCFGFCRNGSLLGRRRIPCEHSGAVVNHGIQYFQII